MDKILIQNRTKEILEEADRPKKFTEGLRELLQTLVDRDATRNYQRIIPDTGKFYGVPKPVLWIIASEIGRFIEKESEKAEALLRIIWAEGSYESKQIAGKSLEKFGPKNPGICLDFITSALPDLDNWSVCDSLAMYAVKPIVYSNPELVLPLSERWIRNNNKWTRRFGVVTLLGYKKIKVTEKVFELLDMVMEDKDKDVKMAVSWILRDITKGNPEQMARYLERWAKSNPSKDARWIIKNGLKKLNYNEQNKILGLLG